MKRINAVFKIIMGLSKENPHIKRTYISENLLQIGMYFLEPNIVHVGCILAKMAPYVRTVSYLLLPLL